jgi:hypothetical protein
MRIHDADPHPHQYPHVGSLENEGQQSEDDNSDEDISHGFSGKVESISDVTNITDVCPYPWILYRVPVFWGHIVVRNRRITQGYRQKK